MKNLEFNLPVGISRADAKSILDTIIKKIYYAYDMDLNATIAMENVLLDSGEVSPQFTIVFKLHDGRRKFHRDHIQWISGYVQALWDLRNAGGEE